MELPDYRKADADLRPRSRPPPPPPPPPPQQQRQQPKPKEEAGGSAPNIKSEATPIKAPEPKVVVPPLRRSPRAKLRAREPRRPRARAPVAGPGTGTGGSGTGTGTGAGSRLGRRRGGRRRRSAAPRQPGPHRPRLSPRAARAMAARRDRVHAPASGCAGLVSECTVDRGTGVAAIDSQVCNLAHDRLRFRPALNRSGQAVAGWFGYAQRAPR